MALRERDVRGRVDAVYEFALAGDLEGAAQIREALYWELLRSIAWGPARGEEIKAMAREACRLERVPGLYTGAEEVEGDD